MVGANVYPWRSKPDICSKVCPMIIEVKASTSAEGKGLIVTDIEVISQAMERVYGARCTNAMYKKVIALAITYRSAWLLEFTRNIES
jgi:hypothetical protein